MFLDPSASAAVVRKVRPSNELVQAQDPNKSVPEGDNDRPRPKEQGAGSVSLLPGQAFLVIHTENK